MTSGNWKSDFQDAILRRSGLFVNIIAATKIKIEKWIDIEDDSVLLYRTLLKFSKIDKNDKMMAILDSFFVHVSCTSTFNILN